MTAGRMSSTFVGLAAIVALMASPRPMSPGSVLEPHPNSKMIIGKEVNGPKYPVLDRVCS